jgi:hypothetical protein
MNAETAEAKCAVTRALLDERRAEAACCAIVGEYRHHEKRELELAKKRMAKEDSFGFRLEGLVLPPVAVTHAFPWAPVPATLPSMAPKKEPPDARLL